jgi:hypothetical protein
MRSSEYKRVAGDDLSLDDLSPNERAALRKAVPSGALSLSSPASLGIFHPRQPDRGEVDQNRFDRAAGGPGSFHPSGGPLFTPSEGPCPPERRSES